MIAKTPLVDLLPVTIGDLSLRDATPDTITSVMPHRGQERATSAAMKSAHGFGFPAAGRITGKAALRAVWTGRGQCFVIGTGAADASLAATASLTDQSDGWAVMALEGAGAAAVMARLCPLDLRDSVFKRGHTARTEFAHMMSVISRTTKGYEIMVMRGFARTTVHDVTEAMESIAAITEVG